MNNLDQLGMHAGAKPEIFRKARLLRSNMTDAEKRLWDLLKQQPLGLKFRRQHPFGLYILDFYCHRKRISIEIDGKSHNNIVQKNLDEERTAFINSFGVREIRFKNEEVIKHVDKVMNQILNILREDTF